jgi:recombination protein RecT
MAKKTCIIRMAKYLPLSVEILRGIAQDETVRTNLPEEGEDILDLPDMNTYIEIEGEEVAASEEEFDDTGKEAAEKLEEPVKIAAFEEQKGSLTGKKPLEK